MATRVAMLLDHCGVNDNRVIREAKTLLDAGYEVKVFCLNLAENYCDFSQEGVPFIQCGFDIRAAFPFIQPRKQPQCIDALAQVTHDESQTGTDGAKHSLLQRAKRLVGALCFHKAARGAFEKKVMAFKPHIIHAHDLTTLPSGADLAKGLGAKLIYDSHELERSRNEVQTPVFHIIRVMAETKSIAKTDAVLTVSDSIAEELRSQYSIDRPYVILNAPTFASSREHEGNSSTLHNIRDITGISPEQTLGVYIGSIQEGRGLIEAVALLGERPALCVAMVGPAQEGCRQKVLAAAKARGVSSRLFVLDAVASKDLIDFIRAADFAIIPIQNTSRSYNYALPNKLFEAVAAALPVVTTPLVELSAFVRHFGVGVVAPGFDAKALADGVETMGANKAEIQADLSAHDWVADYSWPMQAKKLLSVYSAISEGKALPASVPLPHFAKIL